MCGINGFIGHDEAALGRMNAATAHRGPDFAGIFTDGALSLGHVLLSIRDAAEASRQPVRRPGSPWVLAFNGQLYDTRALKKRLGKGFEDVDLDTTLLYALIEREGWDFVGRIHGMFAIALYNVDEGVVRLYRDPSGQKLLYYYHDGKRFIWSSEIKAILTHPGIDRSPDPEAVAVAAALGYIPGGKTLFRRIRKLNLSECVTYDLRAKAFSVAPFASLPTEGYPDDADAAFRQLIEEHLQSKRPIAINLSGGLDSSLLVHEMSRLGHEIRTYTTRFEGGEGKYNVDADLAARLASDYGAKHTEVLVTKASFLARLEEAYRIIEEPNYNISLPAYLQIAEREGARGDGNRVILSGDGGDELFSGYPHYAESRKIDRWRALLTPGLYDALKAWRNGRMIRYGRPEERWMAFRAFRKRFLRDDATDVVGYVRETAEPYRKAYGGLKDSVRDMMAYDRALWMGGENFIRSDKLYMSQCLELRSPLSYQPFRAHWDARLKGSDLVGGTVNKPFLRRHYRGKLPDYIVDRQDKAGWRSPVADWYDAGFKTLFLDAIASVESGGELVDWPRVKRMIETAEGWPGKYAHLYVSLAILAKGYGLRI